MIFSIIYFLISLIVFVLCVPYLLYKKNTTKYKKSIPSRFFLKNNKSFDKNGIWFHSCSMGETISLKPLIDKILEKETIAINISTITNTGFSSAKNITQNVRYLPYELFLPFWIVKQKVLIVMEAELWYMLFFISHIIGIKTILINARISDKSYKSYKKYSWFYKKVFSNIDHVFAQSDIDKKRLIEFGAKNIQIIGNIKVSSKIKPNKIFLKPKDKFVITLASSHKNEEKLILDAYKKHMGKLIIVPRHPERFDEVNSLIKNKILNDDITYGKYSIVKNFNDDITLVDSMGDLINVYAISNCVILGGGFEKIGGHNPIEPAFFGCSLISGEHIFNQKALFECVKNYKIIKNEEILDTMKNIQNLPKTTLVKKGDLAPIIKEIINE